MGKLHKIGTKTFSC